MNIKQHLFNLSLRVRFFVSFHMKTFYYCLSLVLCTASCSYLKSHNNNYGSYSGLIRSEKSTLFLDRTIKDLSFFPINSLRFRLSEKKE